MKSDLVTLDFETAYSKDFNLGKLSTEEYVTDPRFEIIGVGIKINGGEAKWFPQPMVQQALGVIDWEHSCLLCQNTAFDGLILQYIFGIVPFMYLDTMLMARPTVLPFTGSSSLKMTAPYLQCGEKGTEVYDMKGKWYTNFTPEELNAYGEYCKNDCELTYAVFKQLMADGFPRDELSVIDDTLRMYLTPSLLLDSSKINKYITELEESRAELLVRAAMLAGVSSAQELNSNLQFAGILKTLGVEPPVKISPTTGKLTWAFAKSDREFMDLLDHDSAAVRTLVEARLSVKSSIRVTRARRFKLIADMHGYLRVPLLYYGAHTGRYSGMESINLQNLPRGGTLRHAIKAPPGYVLLSSDLSQIEARMTAWMAHQYDLLQAFKEGRDVYCEFASKIYHRTITKEDAKERFQGKTAILGLGYGMGADKYKIYLGAQGMDITVQEAQNVVTLYRDTYANIPQLWKRGDRALASIRGGTYTSFGPCVTHKDRLELPNGLSLHYPKLIGVDGEWSYISGHRRLAVQKIYGAKLVENTVQALAQLVLKWQAAQIKKRYGMRAVMQVHDELVYLVPEDQIEYAMSRVLDVMHTAPDWCKDLPVAAEAAYGASYGEAK